MLIKGFAVFVAVLAWGTQSDAWGGLFNRFSPEMLTNMGYGSHSDYTQRSGDLGYLEEYGLDNNDDQPCYGKPCTANEHCCPESVCVDVDGGLGYPFIKPDPELSENDYLMEEFIFTGTCLFAYGRRAGELCRRDSDCESGLLCVDSESGGSARVCRPPLRQDKQYSESCNMSSECDITRGLCCQLQRRHRQAPRKVCSYFKDPLVCIGPVASDQIKSSIQHTAGEKRLTSFSGFKRPLH